jgi:hypothetical protein
MSSAASRDSLESGVSEAKTVVRSSLFGSVVGDEFEGFVVGGIDVQAVDEYAGDLVPGDDAVGG